MFRTIFKLIPLMLLVFAVEAEETKATLQEFKGTGGCSKCVFGEATKAKKCTPVLKVGEKFYSLSPAEKADEKIKEMLRDCPKDLKGRVAVKGTESKGNDGLLKIAVQSIQPDPAHEDGVKDEKKKDIEETKKGDKKGAWLPGYNPDHALARKGNDSSPFWKKYYPGFQNWLNPLDKFWDGLILPEKDKKFRIPLKEELPPECRVDPEVSDKLESCFEEPAGNKISMK